MRGLSLIVLFSFYATANAQAPDTLWTTKYGSSQADFGVRTLVAPDDRVFILGTNGPDYFASEVSANGDSLWYQTFLSNGTDQCFGGCIGNDNSLLIAGFKLGGNSRDAYIVKCGFDGQLVWSRTYGTPLDEYGFDVLPAPDSGYYVVCRIQTPVDNQNFTIMRIDENGDSLWSRHYGAHWDDESRSMIRTSDGGAIMIGHSESFSSDVDIWVLKLDSNLDCVWSRVLNPGGTDLGFTISELDNGNFVVGGAAGSRPYVAILRSSGEVVSSLVLSGTSGHVYSLLPQPGSEFMACGDGNISGLTQSTDLLVWRFSGTGDSLWTAPAPVSLTQTGGSAAQLSDNSFVLSGKISNNVFAVRFAAPVPPDEIAVVAPALDESVPFGSPYTITWTSFGIDGGVSIELNRNYPNDEWEIVSEYTENDGAYEWNVSDPLSTTCKLRLCGVEESRCFESSTFAIVSLQGYLSFVANEQPNSAVFSWNAGVFECPQIASRWFAMKNIGNGDVMIESIMGPSSAQFAYVSDCEFPFTLEPNEISSCSLGVTYDPDDNGTHTDLIRVQSDGANSTDGYFDFEVSGARTTTPTPPHLVISNVGEDALLQWSPVDTSIGGCSVSGLRYLIFFSEEPEGPFYYHGGTTDTAYIHIWQETYAPRMSYQIVAVDAPLPVIMGIAPLMEMEQALSHLKDHDRSVMQE